VRLDCQGRVRAGLAESWNADADGRGWTFTLREGARFPEGTPLTATYVIAALRRSDSKVWGIDSAVQLDDRRVHVRVREPGDSAPRLFANPYLAVLGNLAAEPGWSRVDLPPAEGRPPIAFQVVQSGDPRDALDRGADLMVTRDPAVVDYAVNRPELATFPLPWDRTYIILQPPGAEALTIASDSVRRSLARDAVRAEARPAEPPFWWDSLAACGVASDPVEHLTASRIVYPRDDEVARGLAERLVALAGSRTSLRAAALDPAELAAALRDRTERAVVIAAPRESLAPCRDASGWPQGASIRPMIDTRARAIVRRGFPDLTVDWDGTVRVLP
jgi:extracellular solute-binding protein (family 5)